MGIELPDGVQLLRTLTGHEGRIGRIGWSPDGHRLATPSMDRTIRIWDADSGVCLETIRGHRGGVLSAAFDPDGRVLASGGNDGTKLWHADSGQLHTLLDTGDCRSVAFSPKHGILATANGPSEVTLWELATGAVRERLTRHAKFVADVAFDVKGGMLATGSADSTIMLWEIPSGRALRTLSGHSDDVNSVALHPSGEILASASSDHAVRLWEVATGRTSSILEGHTGPVRSLSFSWDGRVLASKSEDGTVRLWDSRSGRCRAVLPALRTRYSAPSAAFHPHLPILAVVGSGGTQSSSTRDGSIVQLWELDLDVLLARPATSSVSYTTAKIVLVGESGVGKTGLGWRLTYGEFVEHASTHGQQFWLFDELGGTGADGTERDAILWDLAGQPDYRLIHALYVDDADLALVLFDPTRGDDPLRGVEYWLRQLGRETAIILVAARGDRGAPRLTAEEIEVFCAERGIAGYVATSALRGDGLGELLERMRVAIRWDQRPTTVTTQTFKLIKDDVLKLKENPHQDAVLSLAQLRVCLEREHPAAEFADDELLTAVRHLSNHGYVALLHTSRDEPRVLLAPVLLNNLAASMVLEARRNPKGLGALHEQQMFTDGYRFPELVALSAEERAVLLDSAVASFLAHSVCFRESDPLTSCSYLVFPELINLKKPIVADEQPVHEGAAYTVSGAVENVYASLVVLLGYTKMFTRTNQWHNHARYVVGDGLVCGLRVEAEREGELDFVLYFGATVDPPIRKLFQSLFESFLARRELTVLRYEAVWCVKGHQVNRAVVREQFAEGEDFAFCARCGRQVALPPVDTPIEMTQQEIAALADQRRAAGQRSRFEQALFRLTTYVTQQGKPTPSCFISYAWGDDHHERWVHVLAQDLAKAGITVVLDRWEIARIGASVPRFVERAAAADRVIVVGTLRYRTKYNNGEPMGGFVVAAEGDLVGNRMIGSEQDKETVLPILREGNPETSFPPLLQGRVYADFRSARQYFPAIFDLISSLYQIATHEPIRELKRQIGEQY